METVINDIMVFLGIETPLYLLIFIAFVTLVKAVKK